ncbi:MAG TPA: outer membrane protein assembly factor BamD [Methylomirabilota bacterium]|nr:outer membrane protein assembly factor BamD [Methylomirabilota bacterium]
MTSRGQGGRGAAVLGVVVLVAGCAAEPAAPLLREDFDRLRADLARVEQEVQQGRSALLTEFQAADRRTAQGLTDVQRSLARLTTRLDELGRETGQLQGRLDELRQRVDALALQYDAAGPPPARAAASSAGSPGDAGAPGGPGGRAAGPTAPSGAAPRPPAAAQASELYQTAYIDYTRGNYNLAIAAFQEFIRLYPGTDLAEKAQFWIGESHYSLARAHQSRGERDRAVQELERAIQEFRKLVVVYPRGDRVPSALYKEALALAELGQLQLAEARFQFLVDQFPSTEEAAKAKDELARLRKR